MTNRTIPLLAAMSFATLTMGFGSSAYAANPLTYLNGTYGCTNFENEGTETNQVSTSSLNNAWDDDAIVTFNGAGSVSIVSGSENDLGYISADSSVTGTYTVSASGAVSIALGNGNSTGWVSADGNTLSVANMTAVASGGDAKVQVITCLREDTLALLNTVSGAGALSFNTTGYKNNAVGTIALNANTSGYYNNAIGYSAMSVNTTGYNNNAQGSFALSANTTGYGNSAMGANSLIAVTGGYRNVGVGNNTGTNLTNGSYNVDIGWGVTGSGDETGVVRIGNPTYASSTYIAGVTNNVLTGSQVVINSSGQLGVLSSSERFKTDIAPLPAPAEEKLADLRPVSFHLKSEPDGALQYGLIAEEVNKVYPELVIHDAEGKIQGVRYDELAPLLLGRMQRQEQEIAELRAHDAVMQAVIDRLQASLPATAQ